MKSIDSKRFSVCLDESLKIKKGDLPTNTASIYYEIPKEQVTPEQRSRMKELSFHRLYGGEGISPEKLKERTESRIAGLDLAEIEEDLFASCDCTASEGWRRSYKVCDWERAAVHEDLGKAKRCFKALYKYMLGRKGASLDAITREYPRTEEGKAEEMRILNALRMADIDALEKALSMPGSTTNPAKTKKGR